MYLVRIRRHDTAPSLTLQALSYEGERLDLTDYVTARFSMLPRGSTTLKVDAEAVVEDAENGVLRYDWVEGDTDTPGVFFAEFEIADEDGRKRTLPADGTIRVEVVGDLDDA